MPPKKRQCASDDNASDKTKSKAPKRDPDPGPSSSSSSSGSSGSAQTKGQPGEKSEPEYMEGFCCVCTKELREGEGTRVASGPAWLRHAFQGILAGGGEGGGGHQVKKEDGDKGNVKKEEKGGDLDQNGNKTGEDKERYSVARVCHKCEEYVKSLQLASARLERMREEAEEDYRRETAHSKKWQKKMLERREKLKAACQASARILRARGTPGREALAGDVRTVQAARDAVELEGDDYGYEMEFPSYQEFLDDCGCGSDGNSKLDYYEQARVENEEVEIEESLGSYERKVVPVGGKGKKKKGAKGARR